MLVDAVMVGLALFMFHTLMRSRWLRGEDGTLI